MTWDELSEMTGVEYIPSRREKLFVYGCEAIIGCACIFIFYYIPK